jgi:hypothetical protein
MMEIDPKELAQLHLMFALRRMAPAMQNDVLSDGMVAARAGIDLSHPIKLLEGITLERKLLFSAFQRAADHEPIPDLIDAAGVKHDIRVEIEGESAFLTYGTHRIRFAQGALLSADPDRRLAAGARCLANNTLTAQARQEFIEIVDKPSFSHDDFFAARGLFARGRQKGSAFKRRLPAGRNRALGQHHRYADRVRIPAGFYCAGAFGRTRRADGTRPVRRGQSHFADIRSAGTCSLGGDARDRC